MCPLHDQLRALPLQAHGLLADASIGANIKYVIQKLLILEDDVVCLKQLFFLRDDKRFHRKTGPKFASQTLSTRFLLQLYHSRAISFH